MALFIRQTLRSCFFYVKKCCPWCKKTVRQNYRETDLGARFRRCRSAARSLERRLRNPSQEDIRPLRADEGGRPLTTLEGRIDHQFQIVWAHLSRANDPLLDEAFELIFDVFQDHERTIETLQDTLDFYKP